MIPPNRPVQLIDHDDLVYRTIEAKYKAVADDVAEQTNLYRSPAR